MVTGNWVRVGVRIMVAVTPCMYLGQVVKTMRENGVVGTK